MSHLLWIMARLRDPVAGCPWDVQQTFATVAPHTIEEAYEVADAIDQGNMAALKDELGDLLLQVVFHAQMAAEEGHFTFDDVADAICDKLIRRHPHVFGNVHIADAEQQTRAWEAQKAAERKAEANNPEHSAVAGVTSALPALLRAYKLQKRAERVGFDWDDADGAAGKVAEELAELRHEMENGAPPARLGEELGDLLFSCVNLARKLGIEPEGAMRDGNAKFERRFKRMEALLEAAPGTKWTPPGTGRRPRKPTMPRPGPVIPTTAGIHDGGLGGLPLFRE